LEAEVICFIRIYAEKGALIAGYSQGSQHLCAGAIEKTGRLQQFTILTIQKDRELFNRGRSVLNQA
jgi:hypothetical protein